MVIAPRKMGRANDHETADVTICRNIAELGHASRTQEAFTFELRMADAERPRGCIRQPCWESHHHQVGRSGPWTSRATNCTLRRRWDEFEEKVLEVSFIERYAECAFEIWIVSWVMEEVTRSLPPVW